MHIKSVGSYEAKTHLPALLNAVEQGEKIVITRNGIPIAILMPYHEQKDSPEDIISALLEFRKGRRLDGLSIDDMKKDGRRF
jgi:prevent-host-death family protein